MPDVILTDRSFRKLLADHRRLEHMYWNLVRDRKSAHDQPFQLPQKSDWFKNTSSEEVPPYGVMASTDVEYFQGHDAIKIAKPSTTFRRKHFINGRNDVPVDATDKIQRGDLLRIAYDTGTPANGEVWGPKPSQWTLAKGYPGYICQGLVDMGPDWDSSSHIGLWVPEENNTYIGKSNGTIAKGATNGSMNIFVKPSGTWTDTTIAITNCENLTADIEDDTFVSVYFWGGLPIIAPLECA
jgi:hypothetical protein